MSNGINCLVTQWFKSSSKQLQYLMEGCVGQQFHSLYMIGKCLQQVEHIRGQLWHRYSITVNQVMVLTVKLSKWWLQLNQWELLLTDVTSGAGTAYTFISHCCLPAFCGCPFFSFLWNALYCFHLVIIFLFFFVIVMSWTQCCLCFCNVNVWLPLQVFSLKIQRL
jgi:hypothetical protein